VTDAALKELVGEVRFLSVTYRLFKLPNSLETLCEDYGQVRAPKLAEMSLIQCALPLSTGTQLLLVLVVGHQLVSMPLIGEGLEVQADVYAVRWLLSGRRLRGPGVEVTYTTWDLAGRCV
jgi:hypothetical protein